VQYQQVALQLEVVPLINPEGEVSLDVLQKLDDLSGQSDTIGGNAIPRINTRYIRTNVSIKNGQTVVLGGLIKKRDERSTSGVPLLSRVPFLGFFFRTNNKTFERDELIILIHPVVSTTPTEDVDVAEREQEHVSMEADLETILDPKGTRVRSNKLLAPPNSGLRDWQKSATGR
jgi:type II secretory pathway component GspD/PulD (secretin)